MKIMNSVWNETGSIKTIVLAAIFLTLLFAIIHQRTQQRLEKQRIAEMHKTSIVTEFKRDEIYAIEIYELLSKTEIRLRDDYWMVGFTSIMPNMSQEQKEAAEISIWDIADQDAIRQIIDAVQNSLNNWEIVSTNREKKVEYRIGPLGSEYRFKNERGDVIACINVGEKAADFTGTYVARCNEDEVYKVPGILEYVFKRDPNDWRTKVIHDLGKDNVVRVEITSALSSQPVVIEKDTDDNWIGVSPQEFVPDKKRVDALLTSFCSYSAKGFPERLREPVIQNIDLTLKGTMDDGSEWSLIFGSSEGVLDILVKSDKNNIIYTAGSQDIDNLNMDVNMLTSNNSSDS